MTPPHEKPASARAASLPVRARLAELMAATIADHENWTYDAVRPLSVPLTWRKGQKVVGDCSKGVQYLCRWAGAPDPMGNDFGVWGNSSTICAHLAHLPRATELEIGDIVTFGMNGSLHAAMVREPGVDPVLWSFGGRGAPNSYRLSQDHRASQYLRLPVPPLPPTSPILLRQETGYWAWVQWRLGEGDWQKYAPADKTVRPNVPVLISPVWWAALAHFLALRRKGNPAKPPAGT